MLPYIDPIDNKITNINTKNDILLNYHWKELNAQGTNEIGYVFDYEVCDETEKKLAAINLYYSPELINELEEAKKIFVYCEWIISKSEITKGLFHGIMDDLGDLIKKYVNDFYKNSAEMPQYFLVESYIVSEKGKEYFKHGDYGIEW